MVLFHFLSFWVGNAMRLWFRKVYFHTEAPLPKDAPIIFACTHPNSAIDFVFLPLITKDESFVLVRGDVFEKPWLNKLFRSIWMLPIYRMRDGFGSLNRNEQSFKECFRQFDLNKRVLIFSEGTCVQEKTIQPIRKGTARLAIDYLRNRQGKEIYVVPMANNYSKFRQFRGTVMTNFGTPIPVSQFVPDDPGANPNQAYLKLTEEISKGLERNFIEVKPFADDCWTERALNVLRFARKQEHTNWVVPSDEPFQNERKLVEFMNEHGDDALSADWKERYERLDVSEDLEGILHQSSRPDVHWMLVFALSPFVLLAHVLHFLPYRIAKWIARTKIKDIIFENTVMTLGSALIYLLQWLIALVALTSLLGWTGIAASLSIIAVSMIYTAIVDDYRFAWKNHQKVRNHDDYRQLYDDLVKALKEDRRSTQLAEVG